MQLFSTLVVATIILGTDALNLVKRLDGQPPMVVHHEFQRRHLSRTHRMQIDRERMRRRSSDSFTVSLQNLETLYFIPVTVGTPAQSFKLHIDTGSSDTWLNVATSQLCDRKDNPCGESGLYNANKSSTYQYLNSDFNISYVDGTGSSGDYATDTVSFGSATLKNQQIGIGYTSSSEEGILGIGYASNEVAVSTEGHTYRNVPQSLMDDGYVASNAYSLWLNDIDAQTGSILFGGVNTAYFTGSLETVPIIQEAGIYREFIIALTGVGANGTNSSIASDVAIPALLDSGSSYIYLPEDIVQSIYQSLGVVYDASAETATVDCSLAQSDQTLDFTFSSPTISVRLREMIIYEEDEQGQAVCVLGLGFISGNSALLGDAFIRSAYIVYDMTSNQISLAQTNFSPTEADNILEITNSTGVPDATEVPNAVSSLNVGSGGLARNDQLSAAGPSIAVSYPLLALGFAAAALLYAL